MKQYFIQAGCILAATCLVYTLIIHQIVGEVEAESTDVVISEEEFQEIVRQHQITPVSTPYPDFDLIHLSNVHIVEEVEDDESRTTSTGEFTVDSTEVEGVESVDEPDSGIIESEAVSYISDIGQDYSGEPVPELVESGSNNRNEDGERVDGGGSISSDVGEIYESTLTYLGDWTITAYCPCEICCGAYSSGYTASGTLATAGRTIACNELPFGTQVMIDGCIYTVEDTGWSPYGQWIDIYFDSHDEALAYGMQIKEVYLVE